MSPYPVVFMYDLVIIIITIMVFIESKDKNTYLMLQAIKIKNDLQY